MTLLLAGEGEPPIRTSESDSLINRGHCFIAAEIFFHPLLQEIRILIFAVSRMRMEPACYGKFQVIGKKALISLFKCFFTVSCNSAQ